MLQEIKPAGEFLRNVFLTKWKKKNCMQINISMKQKQTYRYREQICSCQTRKWVGVGKDWKFETQFSSVTQLCPTLWNPKNRSMPGLPVHHQLPDFTQTHVHWVSDAIQTSHSLSSPSPALSLSQHQSLFQWVNSSHEVAKVLEFQL